MGTNTRRDLDDLGPNHAPSVPRAAPSNRADTGPHEIPAAYSFLNLTLDMRRQLLVRGTDEIRLRSRVELCMNPDLTTSLSAFIQDITAKSLASSAHSRTRSL